MQKDNDSIEKFLEMYFKVASLPVPEWMSRGKENV